MRYPNRSLGYRAATARERSYRTLFSILLLLATPLCGADWIKFTTPNFEFYTNTPEREAIKTLESFEQAHDFFYRVKPATITSQLPVTIVGFASTKEYAPYALRVINPAYFMGDAQRDFVVMGYLGDDSSWAAVHEYVHVLVRHSGLTIPLWLNEGMADVYSTIQERNGKILVGASPKGRVQSLTREKWLGINTVVAANTESKEYTGLAGGPIFYAQSWLLTHMLMLSENYSPKFQEFVNNVAASGSTQQAFLEVYSKSLAQVATDMNTYFRQSSIGAKTFDTTLKKVEIAPAKLATELEVGLTLARLSALLGRTAEADDKLAKLAAANPRNPEIDESRAYAALRANDRQAALRHFDAAIEHGATNWKTFWDYAVVLEDREMRIQALRKALEKKPNLVEARVMLSRDLYMGGESADALAELRRIDQAAMAGLHPEIRTALEDLRARLESADVPRQVVPKEPLAPQEDDVPPPRPVLRRGKQR